MEQLTQKNRLLNHDIGLVPDPCSFDLHGVEKGMVKNSVDSMQDLLNLPFCELDLEFSEHPKALWCYQKHERSSCMGETLIHEISILQSLLKNIFLCADISEPPFQYLIWASRHPRIFNLGGDLDALIGLVSRCDRAGLSTYAHACAKIWFANYTNMGLPITTVALVCGDALGGGFESVLSNDIVLVEEGAKLGFPEIAFGLFPSIGAYSALYRRIGSGPTKNLIFTAEFLRGKEIFKLDLAELLAKDGEGEPTLKKYLQHVAKRASVHRSLYAVRRKVEHLTYSEIKAVADLWVETALNLDDRDIARMRRIAKIQSSRFARDGLAA